MAQPGQPQEDHLVTTLVCCLALYFGLILAMNSYRDHMNALIGALCWAHIVAPAYVHRYLGDVLPLGFLQGADAAEAFLAKGGYATMTEGQRNVILSVTGRWSSLVYVPVLIWLGARSRRYRPDEVYKSKPSLDQMIAMQAEHWKTIRHARASDIRKEKDMDIIAAADFIGITRKRLAEGPAATASIMLRPDTPAWRPPRWARSLRPEEVLMTYGAIHDLDEWSSIRTKNPPNADSLLLFPNRWKDVDLESTMEILASQLTRPWTDFNALRPCHRALCAVFALFYDYKNSEGEALLNDCSIIYERSGRAIGMDKAVEAENGFLARIARILNGNQGKQLAAAADRHAWLETAMVQMLSLSRKDRGVLAAAQFIWLKVEDRGLWYALVNTGGDAFMAESAGVMAHHKAETQLGLPLRRPAVYQAARAMIEDYLDMRPERIEKRHLRAEDSLTVEQRLDRSFRLHSRDAA